MLVAAQRLVFTLSLIGVMWAAVAVGSSLLDSTWLVIVLDVFEGPQTSRCTTTTQTDSTQQQRMTRNGHNHFCNKSENFWMARKQREREGGIVYGPELPCVAGADQTNAESSWGLISLRMNCQFCPGLSSKWELVHYGSAARYFTTYLEIGPDEEGVVTD